MFFMTLSFGCVCVAIFRAEIEKFKLKAPTSLAPKQRGTAQIRPSFEEHLEGIHD